MTRASYFRRRYARRSVHHKNIGSLAPTPFTYAGCRPLRSAPSLAHIFPLPTASFHDLIYSPLLPVDCLTRHPLLLTFAASQPLHPAPHIHTCAPSIASAGTTRHQPIKRLAEAQPMAPTAPNRSPWFPWQTHPRRTQCGVGADEPFVTNVKCARARIPDAPLPRLCGRPA